MTANPFFGWRPPLPRTLHQLGFAHELVDVEVAIALSVVVGPQRGRPALVLVPAQMGTWHTWQPVMPALAERFDVFVVEVRGHGASSWTTGHYDWNTVGRDVVEVIRRRVGRPAIVCGNSSGGIVALWCARHAPADVVAIVLEDAPVFSVEWPRFRDRDRFVYAGLAAIADALGDVDDRNLTDYFRRTALPVSETRTKTMPAWFVRHLERQLAKHARRHPGEPAGIDAWWLPAALNDLFRALSMFDPDFARAFVDGRFYVDFDHAEALTQVRCPLLLLHGDWKRYASHGLVGALDDDDARRVQQLAPQTVYRAIAANHVIHRYEPKAFVDAVVDFARGAAIID